MSLGSRINEIRREKKLSIDDLCTKSGIPKGTLSKITAGITTSPTLDTVRAIASALDCRLDDLDDTPKRDGLSPVEKEHIQKYRLLDLYGKEAVDGVLDVEYRRCDEEQKARTAEAIRAERERTSREAAEEIEPEIEVIYYIIPGFMSPASAGTGQIADDEYPEEFELTKRPPRGTSFIVRVSGNSMEPTYYNGDLVFVCSTNDIQIGQIGVFYMDGQQWIKERGDGELISHNPDPQYSPRPFTPDIHCQGLVLGVCDESYFDN